MKTRGLRTDDGSCLLRPVVSYVYPQTALLDELLVATDLYNYWTKHASNDPSAEMQGAAVTCYVYIPTGR